jgi:hypothetical protein
VLQSAGQVHLGCTRKLSGYAGEHEVGISCCAVAVNGSVFDRCACDVRKRRAVSGYEPNRLLRAVDACFFSDGRGLRGAARLLVCSRRLCSTPAVERTSQTSRNHDTMALIITISGH